ncbi:aldose 1-epimerase family protein [Phycicoccus sp. Root101]|uniref:aldose 1-epimerase family protein n=1 Tax=Phycicoccus sp. Root101 TaxID=1736421 RepID=UPI000703332E|nr:aldose 1-epimerase family protein [Phycicoccus sp. Root101]KQU67524.1 galactose mutarotase [Phycicoccus sp. Root101]
MSTSPSGEQWTLRNGRQEATVVEVGGGLRTYTVDGVDVVAGYAEDEFCLAGRGQVLMPWPNRIRGGRYTFAGVDHQLALTEIPLSNSNHGLVRWLPWQLHWHDDDWSALTVRTRLHPSPGWDGSLDLSVNYVLDDDGLTVSAHAVNVGSSPAPFGYGAHPYVALGETRLADVELTIPATREVLVDEQMIPVATEPVRPETDFREGRALGGTSLDTAYTDLARTRADGGWEVVVGGLATGEVRVWGDRALDWVQVFTAKGADTGVKGTRGIAVEPMSCPSNAFNSGDGLVVLEPGQDWSATWGMNPSHLA